MRRGTVRIDRAVTFVRGNWTLLSNVSVSDMASVTFYGVPCNGFLFLDVIVAKVKQKQYPGRYVIEDHSITGTL